MVTPKVAIISEESNVTQKVIEEIHFHNIPVDEIIEKPREAYLKINPKEPRVIIFVEPSDQSISLQIIQQLKKVSPEAPIIYMGRGGSFSEYRTIFRAGIFDLVQFPDELPDLEKSILQAMQQAKVVNKKSTVNKHSQTTGSILSVYSGKGGTGTSLISANLANSLAVQTGARVLLLDLNLQFGGIHTLFNIRHDRNIGDLKPVMRELTENLLHNVIYKMEETGLSILLSPNSPEESENFLSEDIDLLLFACRSHFDMVILDIPKELNEISIGALNNSDHILYVVNQERPSIVRMQNVLDLLERYHLIDDDNLSIIVNRFSKKHDIGIEELKRMTRFRIKGTIADDFHQLQNYINLGIPMQKSKKQKMKRGPFKDLHDLTISTVQMVGGDSHVDIP